MPTSRKRIGYLPSEEVQKIIDKICLRNNISQSKVTGILVEEALKARKLYGLNNDNNETSLEIDLNDNFCNSKNSNKSDSIANKNKYISEDKEYKLIKEYLNYKNFKKLLSIVQSES